MELDDGTRICIACHAALADERYLHNEAPPTREGSFLVVPVEADYGAPADALKPVTLRFSIRDRERAKVLAKAQGIGSYQSYIKQLIAEGLDRDEKRLFAKKVGDATHDTKACAGKASTSRKAAK